MKKQFKKMATATLAGVILAGPVYFTLESGKANAETQEQVDEEMAQRKKTGDALLQEIDNSQSEFNDPSAAEELRAQVKNYRDGVADRGKGTWTAKAGAQAIKATVHKVGKKSWNKLVSRIEKTTGTRLVMFHYQSINKFCNIVTGFEGTLTDAIAKTLINNYGFNKSIAYVVARAFITIVL